MTDVGVRLCEAPDVPSRDEVHIRIPSGQLRSSGHGLLSVTAFLSGDIHSTRLAHCPDRPCLRLPEQTRQARKTADCAMTGLADLGGGENDSAAMPSGWRLLTGDLTSWKDLL